MKRRTRLFVIGAVGILVVGLGTGLVASYMGIQRFAIIGANGPDELQYVSKGTQWVAFANVRDVMDSELRQKLRQLHPDTAPGGTDKFKAETGIDIEADVDRIVIAAADVGPDFEDNRPLLVARGRFDQTRIEGLVREHGGTATDYRGKRMLTIPGEHEAALAFIEPDLVAVGTPASVRTALDTKASGANVTGDAEVMNLVREVDNGNAWAVARFEALTRHHNIPGNVMAQLPPITWFSVSGHVNGGVHGTVRAIARDEAAANNLRDVVKGFMALARMQVGGRADFADLLDSLQLSGDGNAVAVDFAVPASLIDTLGAMRAARPRQRDGQPELTPQLREWRQQRSAPRSPTL